MDTCLGWKQEFPPVIENYYNRRYVLQDSFTMKRKAEDNCFIADDIQANCVYLCDHVLPVSTMYVNLQLA